MTQFSFTNANNGVITKVYQGSEDDDGFIELTVRGTNTVKNVIKAISKAESIEPNCN